jgi:hypothetical protein
MLTSINERMENCHCSKCMLCSSKAHMVVFSEYTIYLSVQIEGEFLTSVPVIANGVQLQSSGMKSKREKISFSV